MPEPRFPDDSLPGLSADAAAQLKAQRFDEAAGLYRRALALAPRDGPLRKNLALALRGAGRHAEGEALLRALLAEAPLDAFLHRELGKVHVLTGAFAAALADFERALALDPENAESRYWIGGVRHAMGDLAAAERHYARAAEQSPIISRAAHRSPPDFAVLLLCAPVAANTPIVYLTENSPYATHLLLLFAEGRPDVEMLRKSADLVVNLVSDPDQAGPLLPLAADLVDRIGLPVVNPPAEVLKTTREAVAERLAGTPGCVVPRTRRLAAGAAPPTLAYPLLVRPAGTHGGDDFEQIAGTAELAGFIGRHPGCDHYLIDYVDYASADGHFRKYRFIFVGEQILPYHLAIGTHWKVHHATTDMIDHPWMQEEERAFLEAPDRVFSPSNFVALAAIRKTFALDFFGIDCGLDRSGRLVVFEVNTSMLVHPHNAAFPYKMPHVQAIKAAFDALLGRLARGGAKGVSSVPGTAQASIGGLCTKPCRSPG